MLGDDSEALNISGPAGFAKCLLHALRDTLGMEARVAVPRAGLATASAALRPDLDQGFPQAGRASVQWKVALKIGNPGGSAVCGLCGCPVGVVRCVHVVSPGI
jgi:hypothetical protein